MAITRQQVADLREGDTIQIEGWYDLTVQGRVSTAPTNRSLWLGQYTLLRDDDGNPAQWCRTPEAHLTVVSRAPRPLYVNSDRTEPVPGDYARDADADGIRLILRTRGQAFPDKWIDQDGIERSYDHIPGRRLRLLVDGETGQVVQ